VEASEKQSTFRKRSWTNVSQQFRVDKFLKPRATLQLQQIIPHESAEEDSFVSAYGSYLRMLDNFEQYQRGAVRRISETREFLGDGQPGVQQGGVEQFELEAPITSSAK
jgi:hypothetical protein